MQLASDAATKPPSRDRVFEAASVVPSSFCSSFQNPELLVTSRNGAVSGASACLVGTGRPGDRFFAVAALNS